MEGRRLLASGVLDTSFGSNGVVSGYSEVFPGGVAHAAVVQPDRKILVAGGSGQDSGQPGQTLQSSFAMVRLLTDGTPDAGFGTAGFQTAAPVPFCSIHAIALQPDGKIIAAGAGGENGTGARVHMIVERFNTDGTPDSTFGNGGF